MSAHPQASWSAAGNDKDPTNEKIADLRRRIRALESNKGGITANAISGEQISPGSITTEEIAAGAIKAEQIAAGVIYAGHIAADTIQTNHILAGAVTADKIAANTIQAGHIQANSITAGVIQAGAIQASHIQAGAIQAGHIQANSIEAEHIQAGSIQAGHIASNSITALHIAAGSILATHIQAAQITATHIAGQTLSTLASQTGDLTVDGTLVVGGAGFIRTSVGNQYTEFSAAGIKSYDITDPSNPTFSLSSATGIATARMVIQTGTQMPLGFIGGANMLPNASCERPDGTTTPWVASADSGGAPTVVRDATRAVHGSYSFKVTHTTATASEGVTHQATPVACLPSTAHTVSAWVYPTTARAFKFYTVQRNSGGTILSTPGYTSAVLPANAWSRISYTFTTQATAATIGISVISSAALGAAESFWVDAVQLEPGEIATAFAPRTDEVLPGSITATHLAADSVTAAAIQAGSVTAAKLSTTIAGGNMLSNATTSFENDIAGWVSTGIVFLNGGSSIASSATQAYFGTKSLRVITSASPGSQGVGVSVVPGIFRAGSKYTFSAYVRSGAAGTYRICLGRDPYVAGDLAESPVTFAANTWKRISVTWTPLTDAATAQLAVRLDDALATTFYIDAAQLEEGEGATGWKQYIAPAAIEGSTITAATIQTIAGAQFGTGTVLDGNGLQVYNSAALTSQMKAGVGGLDFKADTSFSIFADPVRSVRWQRTMGAVDRASTAASIVGVAPATGATLVLTANRADNVASNVYLEANTSSPGRFWADVSGASAPRVIIDQNDKSNFIQTEIAGSTAEHKFLWKGPYQWQIGNLASGGAATKTVSNPYGLTGAIMGSLWEWGGATGQVSWGFHKDATNFYLAAKNNGPAAVGVDFVFWKIDQTATTIV
jgi:hypothetical protein